MENLHVDLALTAAAIGAGIVSVGALRAVEKHAIDRARRRTKDILASVASVDPTPVGPTTDTERLATSAASRTSADNPP